MLETFPNLIIFIFQRQAPHFWYVITIFVLPRCTFIYRVLVNSRFGVLNSNFLSLTPTFYKVSTEKDSKTLLFLEDSVFTPIFKIL